MHKTGKIKGGRNIQDGSSGDVTCDFYHKYEEDIQLMKALGIPTFLTTISWPRVIPDGTGEVNRKGIDFYRNVLKCLRKNGIKSYVALYHWDLPQKLQEKGGWMNRDIVGWFENYARTMYAELGDLVDCWITMVEPWCASFAGHWMGACPPGLQDYSAALRAVHHVNLAHGIAVKAFRESDLHGEIGIKLNLSMVHPLNPELEKDVEAAKREHNNMNVLFCEPILKGTYPAEHFEYLKAQGVVLPEILPGDMELICQKIDFLGVNNYSSTRSKNSPNGKAGYSGRKSFSECFPVRAEVDRHPGW